MDFERPHVYPKINCLSVFFWLLHLLFRTTYIFISFHAELMYISSHLGLDSWILYFVRELEFAHALRCHTTSSSSWSFSPSSFFVVVTRRRIQVEYQINFESAPFPPRLTRSYLVYYIQSIFSCKLVRTAHPSSSPSLPLFFLIHFHCCYCCCLTITDSECNTG